MIECVNPSKVMYSKKEEYNSNENCLVLLLSDYKTNTKCMFAGDISSDTENILIDKYGNNGKLDVDVYKVNHHGSKFSNSERWLKYLSPDISIISCSENNNYGHPHKETIERLKKAASKVFYTKEQGQVKIDEKTLEFIKNNI